MSTAVAKQKRIRTVDDLKRAMIELDAPLNLPPEHHFAPGMYCRELFMPAGSVIVSKIHKTEHFAVALFGRATVVIGDRREEIVAPKLMRTLPGTERALYIHEDSLWLTFHPTNETDLEKIENAIIAKDHDDPVLLEHRRRIAGEQL